MSVGLTFGASGFLCIYQLGVAHCLVKHVPRLLQKIQTIQGVSGGALASVALVGRPDLLYADLYESALHGKLYSTLEEVLPKDIHKIAHEKGVIILCAGSSNLRGTDEQLHKFSKWDSRDDFFKTLKASTLVNDAIDWGEIRIYDAAVLTTLPETSCEESILVSPFAGPKATIGPEDDPTRFTKDVKGQPVYLNVENFRRAGSSLQYPGEEELAMHFRDGYDDCMRWCRDNREKDLFTRLQIAIMN